MTPDEIALLLPAIVQRAISSDGTPLAALLGAMSALHERPEETLAEFDTTLDPYRAPDEFVPFLAQWVNLDRIFTTTRGAEPPISTGLDRLRDLTASAASLVRWRGTNEGLLHFLRVATGLDGFSIDEPHAHASTRPFHIVVHAPRAAEPHRALIARIVEVERPGYCTWEIEFVK